MSAAAVAGNQAEPPARVPPTIAAPAAPSATPSRGRAAGSRTRRKKEIDPTRRATALGRWVGLGPYYAMFPTPFAFDVVQRYSRRGDSVLDPFAGRATSVFAATVLGRSGLGVEINPLGWLYGQVKLGPAPLHDVLESVGRVSSRAGAVEQAQVDEMPEFFRACYTDRVLRFLIAARDCLNWRESQADATLMAIMMVYLHGAVEKSLSNQMRQGKALSPSYALKWWEEHNSRPPDRDPVQFITEKVLWRYQKGVPAQAEGRVVLGDSTVALEGIRGQLEDGALKPFKLLFTSPPYAGITDYHYDQWLRLWLLGGPPEAVHYNTEHRDDFSNGEAYKRMLDSVFEACSHLLAPDATVYVRTDARQFTYNATLSALASAFPNKRIQVIRRPLAKSSQTVLFGDKGKKPGEMDIILRS